LTFLLKYDIKSWNKRERNYFIKKKNLKEKGITLVALVVTIIVLLVLAGVTISLVMNNNGLISRAKLSKEKYEKSAQDEQTELNNAGKFLSNYGEPSVKTVTTADISKKVVGYKSNNIDLWRVYYVDENYVYIISDTSAGDIVLSDHISGYRGSSNITETALKNLNSKWFSVMGNNSSTEDNAKATAYLMDQSI